jgi:hypothetical protein
MPDVEKQRLVTFLHAQREGVLTVLDGLSPTHLRTPVVPSGWTPLGVLEHLGHAEWHWFQEVMLGETGPPPWTVHPGDARLTTRLSPSEAITFYRDRILESDRVIDRTPLSAVPGGRHEADVDEPVPDLRTVILHMIEETARHLGHLDIARELLDGTTGLAQRF